MDNSAKFQLNPPYCFVTEEMIVLIYLFLLFGCSNSEDRAKMICLVEDYSRNSSVKLLSKYL